jgi:hypothetical protein
VKDEIAFIAAGRDVQEREFVRTLVVVSGGNLDRIAGIAQADEIHAFDDAPGVHIETRDDAFCERHE